VTVVETGLWLSLVLSVAAALMVILAIARRRLRWFFGWPAILWLLFSSAFYVMSLARLYGLSEITPAQLNLWGITTRLWIIMTIMGATLYLLTERRE
jgi:hypothetical protein